MENTPLEDVFRKGTCGFSIAGHVSLPKGKINDESRQVSCGFSMLAAYPGLRKMS